MAAQLDLVQPLDVPVFDKDLAALGVIGEAASWDDDRFIVQSPYVEREHLLDLETLDHETALLSQALRSLRAIRHDYATAPYNDSFNWTHVLDELKRLSRESAKPFTERTYYIVAFRSQIKPSTDYSHLGDLDKAAHAEAIASGGFLRYWFGEPDANLRNLATCVWRSREDALAGGRGPAHRKAAMATRELYASWKIGQHKLIIRDDVADWEIISFK